MAKLLPSLPIWPNFCQVAAAPNPSLRVFLRYFQCSVIPRVVPDDLSRFGSSGIMAKPEDHCGWGCRIVLQRRISLPMPQSDKSCVALPHWSSTCARFAETWPNPRQHWPNSPDTGRAWTGGGPNRPSLAECALESAEITETWPISLQIWQHCPNQPNSGQSPTAAQSADNNVGPENVSAPSQGAWNTPPASEHNHRCLDQSSSRVEFWSNLGRIRPGQN